MNWDLICISLFVLYSLGAGLFFKRQASQNLEEYFLAGRSIQGWTAGCSMTATQYAADTPLLVTGLIATAGLFSLWRLWIYAIAFLLMAFVFSALWRRSGVLTDAEFTELRYHGEGALWLRVLKALHLGTFVNCTVLAMVLIAATRIAEPFLTWHLWLPLDWMRFLADTMQHINFTLTTLPIDHPQIWLISASNLISISLIVIFTWLYSTTGGLRSVVSTDVLQLGFMFTGTALYAYAIVDRLGGFDAITRRLINLYGEAATLRMHIGPPTWDDAIYLACTVIAVQWFAQVNADGTGYLAQRSMACRTDNDARTAGVLFTFLQIVVRSLLWIPIAFGLLILYPVDHLPVLDAASEAFRSNREATFAVGIKQLLSPGARAIMLTAMLAALASTIDTHLNWGASYWTNDIYKRLIMRKWLKREPLQRQLISVARLSSLGILLIALGIAVVMQSIQSAWHLSLLFGGGLGVVLILRWLWYRINLYSEMAAVAGSLIFSAVLLFVFPEMNESKRLLWMVGLSTALVIITTLLTPSEPMEHLRAFYLRVQPPGWWAPVVAGLDFNPKVPMRQLIRGLSAVIFCCITIFLSLIGGVHWMFHGFDKLTAITLSMALLAIPFWKRLGFKRPQKLRSKP